MKCPNCGFENNPGVSKCGKCGIIFAPMAPDNVLNNPAVANPQGVVSNPGVVTQQGVASAPDVASPQGVVSNPGVVNPQSVTNPQVVANSQGVASNPSVAVLNTVVPDVSDIAGAYQVPVSPVDVSNSFVTVPSVPFLVYLFGLLFHPVDTYLAYKDSLDEPKTSILYNSLLLFAMSLMVVIGVYLSTVITLVKAFPSRAGASISGIFQVMFSLEGLRELGWILLLFFLGSIVMSLGYYLFTKLLEGDISFFKVFNIVVCSLVPVCFITCFLGNLVLAIFVSVSWLSEIASLVGILGIFVSIGSLAILTFEETGVNGSKLVVMHLLVLIILYYAIKLFGNVPDIISSIKIGF